MLSESESGSTIRIISRIGNQVTVAIPPGEISMQTVVEVHAWEVQLNADYYAQIATSNSSVTSEIRLGDDVEHMTDYPLVIWGFEDEAEDEGEDEEEDEERELTNREAEAMRHRRRRFLVALRFAHNWETSNGIRLAVPRQGLEEASTSLSHYTRFSNALRDYLAANEDFISALAYDYRSEAVDALLIPVPIDETQRESEPCPICREIYGENTENGISHQACMLPDCRHVFGRACINIWLVQQSKSTCPMCRAELNLGID
ncbi:hypothetical protein SBOR_5640 [Sclerotinia borealis F-4128]|uniref:RING-type domain-containing protein n=1 Tax=Sclerotinia borealis (strain F-4128) TaxID=1432307 RepID=W9CHG2_SCLBF|nr:hypothetical protein SBOR_5640 [Sclerotinia borealis F-4128]